MHYRRIADLAIEQALILSGGLTPQASMNAAITSEIKRRNTLDREQRFLVHGRGFYGLTKPIDSFDGAIRANNDEVESRLRALLAELDPRLFEELIGQLLGQLGFADVVVTKYSGDGGIDLRARLAVGGVTDVRTAIQVKRWASNVSGRTVRELRGGLGPHERGLVITLSNFTKDARAEAEATDRSPISLVNGDRLIELLVENDIGVSRRRVTILELDEGSLLSTGDAAPEDPDQPLMTGVPRPSGGPIRTDKSLTVWPMPGGARVWKESLDAMLAFVAHSGATLVDGVEWMFGQFDRVKSEKVARGYWQVTRSFGLLEIVGEHMALTPAGAMYLASPSAEVLLGVIRNAVAGFDELLAALDAGALSAADGLKLLKTSLGVTWETDAQVKFRLGWLENLGAAVQRTGQWELVRNQPNG